MTVSNSTSRADYTGNGVTTAFAVPFYFLDNTHLKVQRKTISTGAVATLALTADYTVTGAGVGAGGTVTMLVAPTVDQQVSVVRNVPLDQQIHYVPNDPFPAASHEMALDKLTMEVQQINETVGRAVRFSSSDSANGEMPALSLLKDHLLAFDPTTGLPVPSSFTATQLASAVAAIYSASAGPLDALTFLQAGTGAVAYSAQKKLRLLLNPNDFDCVGDGSADDGAKLNKAIDQMRTLVNLAPNGQVAVTLDGGGRAYATTISLNATGLLTGWEIANMAIVGKCTGKAVLDLIGSRSGSLRRNLVYGDPNNMPSVGIQTARSSNPAFGACDGHHWQQVFTRGKFSTAAVHLYGQEGTVYERCQFWNSQNTAYCGIHVGSSLVAMSSDYLAPMTGPTSYVDDVYINCDWLYLPDATNSCAITGISKANPAVVTCASHPFVNGQVVNVGAVLGMTGINNLVGTVASATSTSFALTGINSTGFATYTGGGLVALSQTKPNILFGRAAQHKFINCYAPNYGSNNIQIDFADGQPMCDIDMNFLFEGQGTSSHLQFANVGTIFGFSFKTYNTCSRDWIISTLAGAGTINLLGDVTIAQPTAVVGVNPTLFDTPARYSINGGKMVVPTSSSLTPTTLGQNFHGMLTDIGAGTTTLVNMLVADSRDGAMTPAVIAGSGAITTVSATGNHRRTGKQIWHQFDINVTNNGTGATSLIATMPFTVAFDCVVPGQNTITKKAVMGQMNAGTNIMTIVDATGAYPITGVPQAVVMTGTVLEA